MLFCLFVCFIKGALRNILSQCCKQREWWEEKGKQLILAGATYKALLEEKAFESSFEVNSRNIVQYKQYREGSSKRKTYLRQKPGGSQVKSYWHRWNVGLEKRIWDKGGKSDLGQRSHQRWESGFNFPVSREIMKVFEMRKRRGKPWCSKGFRNQRCQSEFVNRRKSGNVIRKWKAQT